MRSKNLPLLFGGLLFGLALAALILFAGKPAAEQSKPVLQIGDAALDFELKDLGGRPVSLQQMRGQAVLINFWASWCAPCRAEMPVLQKAASQYAGRLVVLGVNYEESQATAQAFAREVGISFPVLLDSNGDAADLYRVRGYPTSFFITADGKLSAQHIGGLTETTLNSYLQKIGVTP